MKLLSSIYGAFRPFLPYSARDVAELLISPDSDLAATGWLRSRRQNAPVDGKGEAIPLYTYPAIAFLKGRIPPDVSVFEFGMGYSTLWWSKVAAEVQSVEHDKIWFDRMTPQLPTNALAKLRSFATTEYVTAACGEGPFDVIVVDGRRRVESAEASLNELSSRGVMIWDNSEREVYSEGLMRIVNQGFKRLDFWGMQPQVAYGSCTSILYKPTNCLGI